VDVDEYVEHDVEVDGAKNIRNRKVDIVAAAGSQGHTLDMVAVRHNLGEANIDTHYFYAPMDVPSSRAPTSAALHDRIDIPEELTYSRTRDSTAYERLPSPLVTFRIGGCNHLGVQVGQAVS
jgi:hypothetical protein